MDTKTVKLLALVAVVAVAVGLTTGQAQVTSQPAASKPASPHAMAKTQLSDAIVAINAAAKAVEAGTSAAADIDKAREAVDKTIAGLQGCRRHIAGGKPSSQPSVMSLLHDGFTKKLQDAAKSLDTAKSAEKAKATTELKTARDLVAGVLSAFGGNATSKPAR